MEANKVLMFFKANLDVGVSLRKVAEVEDLCCILWTDAAWAVRPDGSSQGGYMILVCHRDVLAGREGDYTILDWKSFKLPRMSRSSLHAEA